MDERNPEKDHDNPQREPVRADAMNVPSAVPSLSRPSSPIPHPASRGPRPRFLVIKLADLGDALTITPALRALRSTFPTATIDALVTSVGAAVLSGLDSIDNLICFEKSQFDRRPTALDPFVDALALGLRLRRTRYDRVFLLHHLFTRAGRLKYAALLAATGCAWSGGVAERRPHFLTQVIPDDGYGVRHEADYWLGVVGLIGAENPAPRIEVAIDPNTRERASGLLTNAEFRADRPRIALYPGAGNYSTARQWPVDRYARVATRLIRNFDANVVVVGGSTERGLAERVCDGLGSRCLNLAGQTPDVKTLAGVLSQCDLFVGNDGGVMHLASAVSIPIVAIFGPSNDVSWGPYGNVVWSPGTPARTVVVRADLPCAPCLYRGFLPGTRFGCAARDCLGMIDEATVIQAAQDVLTQTRRRDF